MAINDWVIDPDGRIRRHLLAIRKNEKTEFSLGTRLAIAYLKTVGIQPQRNADGNIQLGQATDIFASGFDDMVWKPFREVTIPTKMAQYLNICYTTF